MRAHTQPAITPSLRGRCARAYNERLAANLAAQEQARRDDEARMQLLLQDLLLNTLDVQVETRDMRVTYRDTDSRAVRAVTGVRITLDGIEIGVQYECDALLVYRRCVGKGCRGGSHCWEPSIPDETYDGVESLADVGALLAEPYTCGTCESRATRRGVA